MCLKLKIGTTWDSSSAFIVDFENIYTFNFEQVFVSRMSNACHNVLETQNALYLFCNKSCKANFIQ